MGRKAEVKFPILFIPPETSLSDFSGGFFLRLKAVPEVEKNATRVDLFIPAHVTMNVALGNNLFAQIHFFLSHIALSKESIPPHGLGFQTIIQ